VLPAHPVLVDNVDQPGVPMSSLGRMGSQTGELLGPLAFCPILDGARHSRGSCSEVRRKETCERSADSSTGENTGDRGQQTEVIDRTGIVSGNPHKR
jgi:hypothetical protein